MPVRRVALPAAAAAALAGAALTVLPSHSSAAPAVAPAAPTAPDPHTQPLVDGCQRNPAGLLTRQSPEWVYVYGDPTPRWVVGTVASGNPRYQAVHTSGGDLPMGHTAYDYNVNVEPDAQYQYLLAGSLADKDGNYVPGGEDFGRIHTEWQDLSVPTFAWAEPGDRITELGSWVWDCGHWGTPGDYSNPDYILPKLGQPCTGVTSQDQCSPTGESTEFHPYRALWDVRARTVTSPYGESEGDLFVSTDATRAGTEAQCAHAHPAPSPAAYGPDYTACLDTSPGWQDVGGHYSFLLPAPPQTATGARLTMRVVDHGSQNAPAPRLTREGDAVRVTFDIPRRPGVPVRMAYAVYAGWDVLPATLPVHVHVSLDNLTVHRAMDPACTVGLPIPNCQLESTRTNPHSVGGNQATTAPGEWNIYYDVSGVWGVFGGGELQPTDGTSYAGHQATDIYIPADQGWRLFFHGRECDLSALGSMLDCPTGTEIADDNDVPGMVLDDYASVASSLGTHRSNGDTRSQDPTSTCPDANPQGCYTLTYTATVVDDVAQRTAAHADVRGQAVGAATVATPNTSPGAGRGAGVAFLGAAWLGWAGRRRRRRA